jgi:hypothetical protein
VHDPSTEAREPAETLEKKRVPGFTAAGEAVACDSAFAVHCRVAINSSSNLRNRFFQ